MVVQGANTLCKHGKANEGADLGDMLLKSYTSLKTPLTPAAVDAIAAILDGFQDGAEAAKVKFAKNAVHWVAHTGEQAAEDGEKAAEDGEEEEEGEEAEGRRALSDRVHLLTARACVQGGPEYYADASRHFLESGAGAEYGGCLYRWARGGYARELDLFLARAVLQLLCLGRLGDANAVRDEFLRLATEAGGGSVPPALDTPLCHFLRFLLLTLEREARPLYLTLLDKYKPSLNRDPEFGAYIQTIGLRFFGIEPPKSAMEAMMSSMASLFGGPGGGHGGGRGAGGAGGGLPFPPGLLGALGGMGGGR